jgi:hypothetical protein
MLIPSMAIIGVTGITAAYTDAGGGAVGFNVGLMTQAPAANPSTNINAAALA